MVKRVWRYRRGLALAGVLGVVCPVARGAERVTERVTLRNGFELDCVRREAVAGDRVRLYMAGGAGEAKDSNYLEVAAGSVASVETIVEAPVAARPQGVATAGEELKAAGLRVEAALTAKEMHEMLARAGAEHHIDEDLLASLVKAESGGKVTAVSRTGARGLMQLMPGTAAALGVKDSFRAEENIAGGTAYLDELLTRYHDNMALALAAYNAGPGAVDRWGGVPPFRETRAYVARVIREFNRRKMLLVAAK